VAQHRLLRWVRCEQIAGLRSVAFISHNFSALLNPASLILLTPDYRHHRLEMDQDSYKKSPFSFSSFFGKIKNPSKSQRLSVPTAGGARGSSPVGIGSGDTTSLSELSPSTASAEASDIWRPRSAPPPSTDTTVEVHFDHATCNNRSSRAVSVRSVCAHNPVLRIKVYALRLSISRVVMYTVSSRQYQALRYYQRVSKLL
jgi:hypothetical protein